MSDKPPTFAQQAFTQKGLFWIVLLAGLVADIATKALADTYVRPTDPYVTDIIPGFIGWKWAENQGAAFSILDGQPILLALIAAVVLSALLGYMFKTEPKRRWFLIALGLVASGAIGNLHDRMLLGHVRDFMFFTFDLPFYGTRIGTERFGYTIPQKYPVFNVADIAIIAGVLLLVLMSFKKQPKSPQKAERADGA